MKKEDKRRWFAVVVCIILAALFFSYFIYDSFLEVEDWEKEGYVCEYTGFDACIDYEYDALISIILGLILSIGSLGFIFPECKHKWIKQTRCKNCGVIK